MGFIRDITGASDQMRAARESTRAQTGAADKAIDEQNKAAAFAQGVYGHLAGVGRMGTRQASFLTDPNAQFRFLENNPLFKLALDNANTQTKGMAAARGRISAGDTLEQLSNNVLLSSSPLISRQMQGILAQLGIADDVAGARASIETSRGANIGNLLTDKGSAQSAGILARAAAKPSQLETFGQAMEIGGQVAGLFGMSDRRLKENILYIGDRGDHSWYSWEWNKDAGELFGLFGRGEGVIADEVSLINPSAVAQHKLGYQMVNYGAL